MHGREVMQTKHVGYRVLSFVCLWGIEDVTPLLQARCQTDTFSSSCLTFTFVTQTYSHTHTLSLSFLFLNENSLFSLLLGSIVVLLVIISLTLEETSYIKSPLLSKLHQLQGLFWFHPWVSALKDTFVFITQTYHTYTHSQPRTLLPQHSYIQNQNRCLTDSARLTCNNIKRKLLSTADHMLKCHSVTC